MDGSPREALKPTSPHPQQKGEAEDGLSSQGLLLVSPYFTAEACPLGEGSGGLTLQGLPAGRGRPRTVKSGPGRCLWSLPGCSPDSQGSGCPVYSGESCPACHPAREACADLAAAAQLAFRCHSPHRPHCQRGPVCGSIVRRGLG